MNLNILPMMDAHVPAIAELERICFSDPWSENSVRAELNNPYSLWLIAEADGELVGYIGSQTAVDEADIMNVAVAPSHRRCGIGQMLIDELAARLKEQGVIALMLEVRASNLPAIALYGKIGFLQAGRRPGYYRKPKEDALILRKEWSL